MTLSPSPTPSALLALASSASIKTEAGTDFKMVSASQASSASATPPPPSQTPSHSQPPLTQSPQDKAKLKGKLLRPKQEHSQDQQQQEPALGFQEFQIMSCDRHGWRYDVMRFDARKPVDIMSWARPVKLNRKELRRDAGANSALGSAMAVSAGAGATPVPAGPMLGPDGKPVIGPGGRVVMVDSEGRPIQENGKTAAGGSGSSTRSGSAALNGKDEKKKKKFQKKTRQVFLVPDHVRQLRRDERYPWVFEDASGKEVWEGRMEDAAKSEMHGLFMPTTDNVFRFVPVHRWYKFQKRRPQQQMWSLEVAERMMTKMQKSKDPERWLVRRQRNGAAPQVGGLGGPSLVHDAGQGSLGPGGRRLFMVDSGPRGLFGNDDDEEGVSNRRQSQRDVGAEGDIDEFEYEEDFADDEEKMQPDDMAADEEAKELEERLKREYRSANRTREGYVDESDGEDEGETLTSAGKSIKKLVRKMEKNAAYESDEEENPYASSEEEESEEEEPEPVQTGPAVQVQHNVRTQSKPGSPRPGPQVPSRTGSPGPGTATPGVKSKTEAAAPVQSTVSASGSAVVGAGMGMGGHSVVAKRATSPKAPKLKVKASAGPAGVGGPGSRAVSPLAGPGSRAGSPSPSLPPGMATTPTKKRKAEDGTVPAPPSTNVSAATGTPKSKKLKPGSPTTGAGPSAATRTAGPASTSAAAAPGEEGGTVPPGTELTREVLVDWLRLWPGRTPRECIRYFQPVLAEKKDVFTKLVKEVANLKDGTLMLKQHYK